MMIALESICPIKGTIISRRLGGALSHFQRRKGYEQIEGDKIGINPFNEENGVFEQGASSSLVAPDEDDKLGENFDAKMKTWGELQDYEIANARVYLDELKDLTNLRQNRIKPENPNSYRDTYTKSSDGFLTYSENLYKDLKARKNHQPLYKGIPGELKRSSLLCDRFMKEVFDSVYAFISINNDLENLYNYFILMLVVFSILSRAVF